MNEATERFFRQGQNAESIHPPPCLRENRSAR